MEVSNNTLCSHWLFEVGDFFFFLYLGVLSNLLGSEGNMESSCFSYDSPSFEIVGHLINLVNFS